MIGWRFPGIFVYHDLAGGDTPIELQLAAMGGSWSHVVESSPDDPSPGEAAMFPQLEARLNISGTAGEMPWNAYFVGHVDRKDMDGVGVDSDVDDLTGSALEAGARIRPGALTLQGNVYYGQAIGQLLGSITQFGDYEGVGGWVQAGYQFDPRWSLWGFFGTDDARDGDAALPPGARDENQILAAMLRYDLPGYAIGLEWLRANTDFVGATESSSATQLALSVFYAF
ncbi:MAG: hypothetical protein GWN71_16685 [Gammaproteobacteria bacterium]|nr:hypothetical protein [Gemmatimonadota bacterium]NIU75153.1 hypothetical protein [Gammaproteobacteria bacterium]